MKVPINSIIVGERKRHKKDITSLKESIKTLGLLSPIIITQDNKLLAGLHRLEACKALEWLEIDVNVIDVDWIVRSITKEGGEVSKEDVLELLEIDENLARNDLTVFEHSQQLLRRKVIYEKIHPETSHGAMGMNNSPFFKDAESASLSKPTVFEHSKELLERKRNYDSFVKDTASKTGISSRTISEEIQIAKDIDPEVSEIIKDTPLAGKKTDLLNIARERNPIRQKEIATKIISGEAKNFKEAIGETKLSNITFRCTVDLDGIDDVIKFLFMLDNNDIMKYITNGNEKLVAKSINVIRESIENKVK